MRTQPGPGGAGTLQFGTCWGVGTDSPHRDQAIDLAEYLSDTTRQAGFAKAFAAMPSVQSATAAYTEAHPEMTAFTDAADSARNVVTVPGWSAVLHLFNHQTHHRGQVLTLLRQLGSPAGIVADIPWGPYFD